MTEPLPTLEELNAYLDGQLTPERRQWIEASLHKYPDLALQLEQLRQQDRHLRLALQPLDHLPPNPQLDPRQIRHRQRQQQRHTLALCASLLLCFMLGNWSGWYTHKSVLLAGEQPMADAMEAFRLVALDTDGDIAGKQSGGLRQIDINQWFDQHFADAGYPPDLSQHGLTAQHLQLVPTADGPAALIVYRSREGQQLMYFVRPPGGLRRFLESGEREESGLLAHYWSDNHFNYALVCQSDFAQLPLVRKLPLSL